jgi:hypothetical protein
MIVLDIEDVPVVIVTASSDATLRTPTLGLEHRLCDLGASALHSSLWSHLLRDSSLPTGRGLRPRELRRGCPFVLD